MYVLRGGSFCLLKIRRPYLSVYVFPYSPDTETAQSLLNKKEGNNLREENESLKNSIKRLHVELSAYQAKYRPPNNNANQVRDLSKHGESYPLTACQFYKEKI